jgi:UDP-2,3-diacylglucosamine pyrophosphatase LpxH
MIVHTKRINYKYGDIIKIKPIFDVHLGNRVCDVAAFKRYLKKNDDKNTYFIGGGDLYEGITVTDKRYRKGMDATLGEAIVDEQVDLAEKLLLPYKDRIIGLGDGNHEKEILRRCGTNITKRLCDKLGVKYLGYSWLIRLLLSTNGSKGRKVIIRGHHGWGGGSRTQGADLTKYSKDLQYWQADIFLYGHVHRKQSDEVPRIGLVGERMVTKDKLMVICGTFLKTYTGSVVSTYSEERGYPPVKVGGQVVNIKPLMHKWVRYWIGSEA